MSKLSKIEQNILQFKRLLTDSHQQNPATPIFQGEDVEVLKGRIEELELRRKFILDRRESWLPKTTWNLLVPIVVSIIATIFTLLVSESVSWSN